MNDHPGAVSLSFRSDNVATVAPEIMRALGAANHGLAASYGDDQYSALLNRKFSDLFESEVTVFPVSTGTAAPLLTASPAPFSAPSSACSAPSSCSPRWRRPGSCGR